MESQQQEVFVLDKLTYAGNLKNLEQFSAKNNYHFIQGDICDATFIQDLFDKHQFDLVVHFAAESHVDNSITSPVIFSKSNYNGVQNILELIRSKVYDRPFFVHISTDEVYGEIFKGSFKENSRFNPSNPYSSSKAAAEMIVNGYKYSYKLPAIIVRANNIFGTRQHPEKLIASCCSNLIKGKKIFLHGSGSQKRSFLFVEDFCRAIYKIIIRGKLNNVYNIGSKFEYKNRDVVKLILRKFNKNFKKNVVKIKDRPFNDFRYSIDFKKIKKLSWKPKYKLEDKIDDIIQWYKSNYKQFK